MLPCGVTSRISIRAFVAGHAAVEAAVKLNSPTVWSSHVTLRGDIWALPAESYSVAVSDQFVKSAGAPSFCREPAS